MALLKEEFYSEIYKGHSFPLVKVTRNKRYLLLKRVMDIIGAMIGIVFFSPVILFISVLIKIEDWRSPIIFKQIRIGKYGEKFYLLKFRSMISDAEEKLQDLLDDNEVEGAMFKIKEDPRITKIGKFIRKTSIDELPQLWNVIKGEMSLVGPRPPLPREVEFYTNFDKQRLLVIPGCTGLWQVSGRNSLNFDQMVKLDLYYIENRSLLFDIKIILKTFNAMFGKNAY